MAKLDHNIVGVCGNTQAKNFASPFLMAPFS